MPRQRASLADLLAIAISPVLIMALVGSLVFFLVEVLYAGPFGFRMRWILFFFVFGAVLIARITMEASIAGRAGLYGAVLGGLTWLALQSFVNYDDSSPVGDFGPVINIGLVAIIWWCAHRLTWDCTYIDDNVDDSGVGLLQASGLEKPDGPAPASAATTAAPPEKPRRARRPKFAWWEPAAHERQESHRFPHTPGVWVFYFSMAALPIFGLGEALIPVDNAESRRHAFWLMMIYVGSGLSLLLATSFLGLRRYLRQRHLDTPLSMVGVWLTMGGAQVIALLFLGACLPRPYPEFTLFELTQARAPERDPSRFDVLGHDRGTKGEGDSDNQEKDGDRVRDSQSKDAASRAKDKDGRDAGKQKDDSGKGESSEKDKQRDSSASKKTEKLEPREKSSKTDAKTKKDADQRGSEPSREKKDSGRSSGRTPEAPSISRFLSGLARPLRWLVYGLLALVALYALGRMLWALLKHLANFSAWARSLLDSLQAWWRGVVGQRKTRAEPDSTGAVAPRVPFSAYRNPFRTGAARMSPEQVVRYSFEALEAYARELGHERQPDETPLEFANRLGEERPALADDVLALSRLYTHIAYASTRLAPSAIGPVKRFWDNIHESARPC
jgi:hypothetical protein